MARNVTIEMLIFPSMFLFVIKSFLASFFFVIRSCERGDVVLLFVLSPLYNQVAIMITTMAKISMMAYILDMG